MEDIDEFIAQSKEIEIRALEMVYKEVDRIINNKITDISIIEHVLDIILGFNYVDAFDIFNKLNNYYENVNKDYSHEYKLIYKELKENI